MHVFTETGSAVLGAMMPLITEIKQGREAGIDDKINVSSASAITAVWTTQGNKFFASERYTPATAITRTDPYQNLIYKLHELLIPKKTISNTSA